MAEFIQGTLTFANLMLSIFVMVYAASLILKSPTRQHKIPWVSLFFASIVFFILESAKALHFLGFIDIGSATVYLDSLFISAVLFVFVIQHRILVGQEFILIHRRGKKTSIQKHSETKTEVRHLVTIKKK